MFYKLGTKQAHIQRPEEEGYVGDSEPGWKKRDVVTSLITENVGATKYRSSRRIREMFYESEAPLHVTS